MTWSCSVRIKVAVIGFLRVYDFISQIAPTKCCRERYQSNNNKAARRTVWDQTFANASWSRQLKSQRTGIKNGKLQKSSDRRFAEQNPKIVCLRKYVSRNLLVQKWSPTQYLRLLTKNTHTKMYESTSSKVGFFLFYWPTTHGAFVRGRTPLQRYI